MTRGARPSRSGAVFYLATFAFRPFPTDTPLMAFAQRSLRAEPQRGRPLIARGVSPWTNQENGNKAPTGRKKCWSGQDAFAPLGLASCSLPRPGAYAPG